MIAYLLKSAACLALLLGFYHLVLEKEKMHTFNRFYLLIGVLASFLIPLATITTVVYVEPITFSPQEIIGNPVFQTTATEMISEETTIDYNQLFITLYLMISTLFFIRFSSNLFKIINKIRKNTQINYQNAILVLVDDPILPHTFWNYIFIHKNDYENQKIEQELFTHELTHVTQKHTLDVLILEVFQIVFWINPLFIFLKKAIQLNHEFLADEKVIKKHKNTFHYQYLLLNKAAWNNEYYLASNLNYSLTKKRLKMMTTQSSKTKIWFKKLAVIPLLASFIFLFAERVEAQKATPKEHQIDELKVEENNNNVETNKQEKKKINPLEKYNYLNDLYEGDRNLKPHFVNSSVIRQNELETLFSKLGGLYFKLSKEDKKKTKRPIQPHTPYVKLKKNNKVFYKLRKDVTKEDQLLIPPPPPMPNASLEEITKAKQAYINWKKRSGNDISVKEKKTSKKEISYQYRFSIYLNKDNAFDVFGTLTTLENLSSTLAQTHQKTNKEKTKAILVVHTNADKEISQKAQEIIKEYGVLITVVSKYIPWVSDKIKTNRAAVKEKADFSNNLQRDTLPKIILQNNKPAKEKSFTKSLKQLKESKNNQLSKTYSYYLNGSKITQEDVKKIKPNNIQSVDVQKNKDGSQAIYITSKKASEIQLHKNDQKNDLEKIEKSEHLKKMK